MTWGINAEGVTKRLRELEWDNASNLRKRLKGTRAFPIRVNLDTRFFAASVDGHLSGSGATSPGPATENFIKSVLRVRAAHRPDAMVLRRNR